MDKRIGKMKGIWYTDMENYDYGESQWQVKLKEQDRKLWGLDDFNPTLTQNDDEEMRQIMMRVKFKDVGIKGDLHYFSLYFQHYHISTWNLYFFQNEYVTSKNSVLNYTEHSNFPLLLRSYVI